MTYHQFQSIIARMDLPLPPVPTITADCVGEAYTPLQADHDEKYGVPTLDELGKLIN